MEDTTITIKKASIWKYSVFLLIALMVVGGFVFVSGSDKIQKVANSADSNGNSVNIGDAQKITLSTKNYNYYPNTITVKNGKPVELTLDSSVQGCLRSFNIKDLGVRGYSQSPSQTIDFTPTQKGTFRFTCSMGMGYGNIIVE